MNQSLSQKKESTDTHKDEQYASILASVNKSQSTINTSSTQQLIQQYKLNSQSDPNKILIILAQESINQMLSEFIKSGIIAEGNGKYVCEKEIFTPKEMKENILKNYTPLIQQMINQKFENIKLELKRQANNVKKQANNQEKVIIANDIANLKTQLKIQEEFVRKRTEQYLSALYKQNIVQLEQNKANVQIEANRSLQIFQQDTLSGKDKQLTQGYQGQIIQLNQQKLQIDQAKQKQDQHIQNLQSQYQSDLQRQEQHEQRQQQLQYQQIQEQQQHDQLIKLQTDIANRANQNVRDQIAAAKANNDALIAANIQLTEAQINANIQLTQAQIVANKQNTQAQIDANAQNTQSVIQNATDAANAQLQALQSLGANIIGLQTNFANMNNQLQSLNSNMQDIGNKIKSPPPGMPPGCIGSSLPSGCQGNKWIMKPEYIDAISIKSRLQHIKIYQCDAGGHFCASDGNQGEWSDLHKYYNNLI
jgi:hypothetical protein